MLPYISSENLFVYVCVFAFVRACAYVLVVLSAESGFSESGCLVHINNEIIVPFL